MNRRLRWLCVVVVAMGMAELLLAARSRPTPPGGTPKSGLAVRVRDAWTNLLAPRTPPRDPPPGRPFAEEPVAYTSAVPTEASLRAAMKGANIVICVLDAARVDHFGAYGYPRDTTPNFDALAKQALVFEQHFCEETQTNPSTLSLFTSQYPDTHGLVSNAFVEVAAASALPPPATLAHSFAQAGYATFFLSSSPLASPGQVLDSGFQWEAFPHRHARRAGAPLSTGISISDSVADLQENVRRAAQDWREQDRPFLAYVHVFPPHTPYRAPKQDVLAFRGKRPPRAWRGAPGYHSERSAAGSIEPGSWLEWANLYDANLRWADTLVGELVAALRETGVLERTLLIVTADHGDAMREHGCAFHSDCPYDETLHIPLLMRFPGACRPVGRVHALTQTIDLFPTLLDLAGVPPPRASLQGKSLSRLLAGKEREPNRYLVSRTAGDPPCYTIRDAHSALLLYDEGKVRRLYDMDRDPWQTTDIYARQRARAAPLEKAFTAFARSQRYPPAGYVGASEARRRRPQPKLTEEQRETLRALGYTK